ncbi:MAG: TIGR03013 family PEP-CTERM/XrtA system glycosyltransferase [Acidobacteria bacterium]|nr:TIGR03013 family PEP-CTERM/XrtA system glycosyltransferase [Acidobacteriota bacterium]
MLAITRAITGRSAGLVVFETTLIVTVIVSAAFVRFGWDAPEFIAAGDGIIRFLVVAAVLQACLYYADLYNMRTLADRRELFVRFVQAIGAGSFLLAGIYYILPQMIIGRGVIVLAALVLVLVIPGWRVLFEWLSRNMRPRERLLLVGTSAATVELSRELFERRHELGVEIVGFVDPDPGKVGAPVINPGVIGTIEDIPSIVRAKSVDRVVVSLADSRGKLPVDKLLEMKLDGVSFDHLASIYEQYTGKIAVENLRPSWLIFSPGFKKSRLLSATKRLVDIVVASVGLALTMPLMAVVAVAIRATSKGAVLYHQQRVGLQGRIFVVHKFRSMREDAESETGPVWASKEGDSRVTPLGSLLRRTRLDELPQLWNVLKGDMSFVGPRPERPEFVANLTKQIPFYRQRHVMRPGLTGWAQVRYTYGASVEDALQKLQYDLFYIKHMSISLDLFIIFSTIKTVILRKGA